MYDRGVPFESDRSEITFVLFASSILSVLPSMSYLGEYVTPVILVWPILFMVCGMVGILILYSWSR